MSPDKLKKLIKLRKSLDKLDNSFIKLVKKRTELVKKVLELKEYKNQIVDKKRIGKILYQIKKKSIKNNIDPKITNKIWIFTKLYDMSACNVVAPLFPVTTKIIIVLRKFVPLVRFREWQKMTVRHI